MSRGSEKELIRRSAVTTNAAKMMGLDHRIGYLRPGYDADVVVWQSHPLDVGAVPAQVYVDGIPQLDLPVTKPRLERSAPPAGNFSREIAYDIATNGEPDYSPRSFYRDVAFINVSSVIMRRNSQLRYLGKGTVILNNGVITCVGVCQISNNLTSIDLHGGTITPGLVSSGSKLGLFGPSDVDLDPESGSPMSTDPISFEPPSLLDHQLIKAADGLTFNTKALWRAVRSGVTYSISPPNVEGTINGLSTMMRLGAKHSLDDGITMEVVALHVTVRAMLNAPAPGLPVQIDALRRLLLGDDRNSQASPLGGVFISAAHGEIPLIVNVVNADAMARLISLKQEVENRWQSKIRMVFHHASEAHILAKEISEANIGVIIAEPRPYPYTREEARCLPGIPLGNQTVISTLHQAGVVSGTWRIALSSLIWIIGRWNWQSWRARARSIKRVCIKMAVGKCQWRL